MALLRKVRDILKLKSLNGRVVARQLVLWRYSLLVVALVSGILSLFLSQRLDFDRSIESMFSANDPLLEPYRTLKRNFVGNEIVLAVYQDPALFADDGSGLVRLSQVADQLKGVFGVKDILSLAEVNAALAQLSGLRVLTGGVEIEFPILDRSNELAKQYLEIFEGYTHGRDGKTVSIVCLLDPEVIDSKMRRQTILSLRKVVQRLPEGRITGEPVLVSDGFAFVEKDGERLGSTSIVLLSLVIVISFRSLRWVIIPVVVLFWSLWMTKAILVIVGLQMSMVSSMLTAIITVISVATIIHLIVRYREARHDHLSKVDSIQRALSLLIVPIFWACVTDAIGFASLMVADTGPVRDFGLMMAVASLCVFAGIALIVPGMVLLGRSTDPQDAWGEYQLKNALNRTTNFANRYSTVVLMISLVLLSVLSLGIFRLEIESDFIKNFRQGSQITEAYNFVEENIGGAGVFDVIVPAPKRLTVRYLQRVEALQEDLRTLTKEAADPSSNELEPALTKIVSLADLDRAARSIRLIPTPELRFLGMSQIMPTFAKAVRCINDDPDQPDYLRIMLRTSQRGKSEQHTQLIDSVDSLAKQHFPESAGMPAAETTGIFVLLANLVQRLLADQFLTFTIASISIFFVMVLAFRSWKLAIISMFPNLVPILMLMGLLGWLSVKLNMGAVMIAAVSIGLSVDSSIHYLWSFKRCIKSGMNVFESVQQSQFRVGRAATFSTLALVAGFLSLCFSDFVPTVYFGVLVSMSMLGGLLGNLVLLPGILFLIYRKPDSKPQKNQSRGRSKFGKDRINRSEVK
ncbi:MAG TPA: MMPL family transporter [Pirellulaceae bacterium]|nr:MMPL family transporter [Pirellulaceae bacterium]HMO93870.1 MMPL family transporter [Pirellulaceae bacterium]HMP67710.1 MMPL family transporter [Pirellulaceae bacterium]